MRILRTLVAVLLLVGCGQKVDITPEAERRTIQSQPDWYVAPDSHVPEGYIYARANDLSRDMMGSEEKAQTMARGILRTNTEDIGQAGAERFFRETGLDEDSDIGKNFQSGQESASDKVLTNTKVIKSETVIEKTSGRDLYRTYVLMTVPDPELETLRQLEKDKLLMMQFEATEYFGELSKKLERFRNRNK
jgi:hypothetical protein|tara:strand:- start:252 stop:824 length:573 start_codon:yes stop_codon:yes gene_type:complete